MDKAVFRSHKVIKQKSAGGVLIPYEVLARKASGPQAMHAISYQNYKTRFYC